MDMKTVRNATIDTLTIIAFFAGVIAWAIFPILLVNVFELPRLGRIVFGGFYFLASLWIFMYYINKTFKS